MLGVILICCTFGLIRLLYYLPMERMNKDLENAWAVQLIRQEKCAKLEEENKNLKLIQETNEKQIQNDIKERDELREENKKLKEERDLYKARNEELNEDCF